MSTVPCLDPSVKRRQYGVIWIPNSFLTAILSLLRSARELQTPVRGPFLLLMRGEILPNLLKLKSLERNVPWPLLSEWGVVSVKYCPASSALIQHVENQENLARGTNLFSGYHLPRNRLWRATSSKKHNRQYFKIQQVCLLCVHFAAVYRQFYASATLQDDEKTRNALLHRWWWREGVHGRVLVKRTVKTSNHHGQLSGKTEIYKRLIRWPQLAQTHFRKKCRVSNYLSGQLCFQLRPLWWSQKKRLQETRASVYQLLSD